MRLIVIVNYKKKLKMLAIITACWLLLFMLGSFLIEHLFLFHITIDSFIEFSYPYGLQVDNILIKNTQTDQPAFSSDRLTRHQVQQFSSYKSLEGKFSFDYPTAFELKAESFAGGDILYHIDFKDKEDVAHGFVQVWNLSEDLGDFLKKSLDYSQKTYKYFNTDSIKVNGVKGYLWDYSVNTENGYYKGSEVFLKKGDQMYRLSYFVPENKWKNNHSEIFSKMIQSFEIKNR